jgi:hypothetical protein
MAARGVNRSRRRPSPLIKRPLYNGSFSDLGSLSHSSHRGMTPPRLATTHIPFRMPTPET